MRLHYAQAALRRFGLRADCTPGQARRAFLHCYVPLARQTVNGRKEPNRKCREMIGCYRQVVSWIARRRPQPYFVAAHGAFHREEWRKIA